MARPISIHPQADATRRYWSDLSGEESADWAGYKDDNQSVPRLQPSTADCLRQSSGLGLPANFRGREDYRAQSDGRDLRAKMPRGHRWRSYSKSSREHPFSARASTKFRAEKSGTRE